MAQAKSYSSLAVLFLVVLRVGIGWQLLYEGLWKINSLDSPAPWSAAGYLTNSMGPMRPFFRQLAGNVDNEDWLSVERVERRWDTWAARFAAHYSRVDGIDRYLSGLLNGPAAFAASLEKLPDGVDFAAARLQSVISYDTASKQLRIDGQQHMLSGEKERLLDQVADRDGAEYDAYRAALEMAFSRASRLSLKERLRAHLQGNPENAGTIDGRIDELSLYRNMTERLEDKTFSASLSYEFEHLQRTQTETREKGAELAGPIIALESELQEQAQKRIPYDVFLAAGPLPQEWTTLRIVDMLTIGGLTGLGLLLVLGLFSRLAALGAAGMIFGFYMAMPPLPGLPEIPGPEHSFIVNKNLIEVMALIALATIPTGVWFGLDSFLQTILRRRKAKVAG